LAPRFLEFAPFDTPHIFVFSKPTPSCLKPFWKPWSDSSKTSHPFASKASPSYEYKTQQGVAPFSPPGLASISIQCQCI
jgi:hypothetical protein